METQTSNPTTQAVSQPNTSPSPSYQQATPQPVYSQAPQPQPQPQMQYQGPPPSTVASYPQWAVSTDQPSPINIAMPPPMPAQAPVQQDWSTQRMPSAPQDNSNPWQQAFSQVVQALSSPVLSRPQESPSAQGTYTPTQGYNQYSPQQFPQANMGMPTSQGNPTYYGNYSQASLQQQMPFANPETPLSGVGRTSAEYPSEAELINAGYTREGLNQYALELEEALEGLVNENQELYVHAMAQEQVMTHPDILASYVNDFFGPDGPYPTPSISELQAYEQQMAMQQAQTGVAAAFDQMAPHEQQVVLDRMTPEEYQQFMMERQYLAQQAEQMRPNFPGVPANAGGESNYWDQFNNVYNYRPEEAYKLVDAMSGAGAFTGKQLFVD